MNQNRYTFASGDVILSVVFFRTESGYEPVRSFLRDLTVEDRKTIGADIKTVQYGWPLGMPLVRKMGPDLWEVRSHMAQGIARVLFTVVTQHMVLLHGFVRQCLQGGIDQRGRRGQCLRQRLEAGLALRQ